MAEIDDLKVENANLKNQMAANSQGIHNLMAQLEAHRGELADSRMISVQLRTNLILFEKSNKELNSRVKSLEALLAAKEESKSEEAQGA